MLVCSLYAVAVQSKTHKGAFAIIFFIWRDPLKHLYWLYYHYVTYKTVNYSSNSIKINLRLLFWKRLMQSRPGHPQNFKLISKFSYMRPVFPDYLSVSYDYALHNPIVPEHQFCGKIAHSGHCSVTIFEKHNRHYVKTQQKRSRTTY